MLTSVVAEQLEYTRAQLALMEQARPEQQAAQLTLTSRAAVLTGEPGCGQGGF